MGQSGLRFAAVIAVLLAGLGSAAAFDVPDDQSCGGLVCDLGLFGHKVEPKPAVAPVAQAPVSPAPVATVDKTQKPEVPRTAHLAKTRVTKTRVAKTPATGAQVAKLAKPVAIPTPIAPKPAVAPPTTPSAAPQNAGTVVLATPYVSTKPQPIQFQSVDPSAALW